MLVIYAWSIRYTRNIFISLCICLIVGITVAFILFSLNKKHIKQKLSNIKEVAQAQNCFNYFALNKKQSIRFFEKLFDATYAEDNFYTSNGKSYYIDFQTEIFTTKELERLVEKDYSNLTVITHNISQMAKDLSSSANIEFMEKEKLFLLMKEKNLYPIEEQKTAKIKNNKLKTLLNSAIERKKAKHYLLYGVLLLSISMLVPFTFLYCIFGSIFIIFGTICLFSKKEIPISK